MYTDSHTVVPALNLIFAATLADGQRYLAQIRPFIAREYSVHFHENMEFGRDGMEWAEITTNWLRELRTHAQMTQTQIFVIIVLPLMKQSVFSPHSELPFSWAVHHGVQESDTAILIKENGPEIIKLRSAYAGAYQGPAHVTRADRDLTVIISDRPQLLAEAEEVLKPEIVEKIITMGDEDGPRYDPAGMPVSYTNEQVRDNLNRIASLNIPVKKILLTKHTKELPAFARLYDRSGRHLTVAQAHQMARWFLARTNFGPGLGYVATCMVLFNQGRGVVYAPRNSGVAEQMQQLVDKHTDAKYKVGYYHG